MIGPHRLRGQKELFRPFSFMKSFCIVFWNIVFSNIVFDLPLKPLNSRSTKWPWRSFLAAYNITLRNYDRYLSIKKENSNFPPLPDYMTLKNLSEFQEAFCEEFEHLESKQADLKTAIISYLNLFDLTMNSQYPENIMTLLRNLIEDKLRDKIFSLATKAYIILSRMDIYCKFFFILK